MHFLHLQQLLLNRIGNAMTDRINADLTPLSDFAAAPFDAPRRMHVAGRVITAMIPDGDVFALFHGPMDGDVMSQDGLQVLSSCDNRAWGWPIIAMAGEEVGKVFATATADEGNPQ